MTLSVAALFSVETAASLLSKGLEYAKAVGLPVTSWRAGDPTRSLYHFVAQILGSLESTVSAYIKAGFLSSATGDWLTILAEEVYGVVRIEATASTPTATLSNTGGGYYDIGEGDLTFSASATGATFHNTSAGVLTPGGTLTLTLVADAEGADGTVAIDEVDTLVTTVLGVSITGSTASVGVDQQSDESLREQCLASLGAISPDGPREAYEYVVRNPELTGSEEITRASASADSVTGTVTVYAASASGTVSGGAITAAQDAIDRWATPLTVTATVAQAPIISVPVSVTVSGTSIPASASDDCQDAVVAALAGLIGPQPLTTARLIALVYSTLLAGGATDVSVSLVAPAADIDLAEGEVPTLSAWTWVEA